MGQSWSERCLLIRENRCWESKHSLICTTEHGTSLQQWLRVREGDTPGSERAQSDEKTAECLSSDRALLAESWTAVGKLIKVARQLPPPPHTVIFQMDVCVVCCKPVGPNLSELHPYLCHGHDTMQLNELNGNNARKLTKFIPSLITERSAFHSLTTINGYDGLILCRLMLWNPPKFFFPSLIMWLNLHFLNICVICSSHYLFH